MFPLRRMIYLSLAVYGLQSVSFANVALGAEAQKAIEATESEKQTPTQPATQSEAMLVKSTGGMQEFVSDGRAIIFEDLGLQLFPISGWNVTAGGIMTAVMQEPVVEQKPSEIDYSQPSFRRNITVSTIHKELPLDEQRAEEIKTQLTTRFAKDPYVKNFQVIEHKFIDHRAKADALLIYTSMTLGKFDMMQLHVVLGGSDKQYLLSYTDFAKDFKETNPVYAAAWQSMLSTALNGTAPTRYGDLVKYGPIAGILFLILIAGFIMQRIAAARSLSKMSDEINSDYGDEDGDLRTATSAVWNLSSKHSEHLPRTNQAGSRQARSSVQVNSRHVANSKFAEESNFFSGF